MAQIKGTMTGSRGTKEVSSSVKCEGVGGRVWSLDYPGFSWHYRSSLQPDGLAIEAGDKLPIYVNGVQVWPR